MSEKFIRVTAGPSELEIREIEDPAVGQNFSTILTEGYTYLVLSCSFTLEASVVVATRFILMGYYLAGVRLAAIPAIGSQVAGEKLEYSFYSNAHATDQSGSSLSMINRLPQRLYLPGGVRIESAIFAMDVGDQISDVSLYFQKWPVLVL